MCLEWGEKTNPVTFQKPLPSATRIWNCAFPQHQKFIVYADLQTGHVSPLHPSMQKAAKPFLCFISLIWIQRVFLKLVNNVNTCPLREWVCYLGILCHLINIKQFCVDKLLCVKCLLTPKFCMLDLLMFMASLNSLACALIAKYLFAT